MAIETDVAIIGAGIVGLAIGKELTDRFPRCSVSIVDKESSVAAHQTSHNSGVVHSGVYYRPGSLKAQLCTEGAASLLRFCQVHEVPYDICGKVIVATQENELPRLEELFRKGQGNGLCGMRMLDAGEIRAIEPHAAGIRGIHVPGDSDRGLPRRCREVRRLDRRPWRNHPALPRGPPGRTFRECNGD